MASSSKPKRIYDVFLSFRGTDIRNNFIGHLYSALNQNGVHTFIDSEELRKGDQISVALMKAIKESRIAIIVFSEDYASSSWCLEEAAKIMECKEQGDLIVFSVFYKVEPKEVRTPRESYDKAMEKHEFKFGKDSEKVKRWKKALFDAGGLSGWHLHKGDESKLIQEIVKDISNYLVQTSLHVAKYPVGIDSRVAELKLMLNLKSHEDVVMVGLWGQGGIGKTTLSKALYNAIFKQFDGSCFLENVREASKNSKDLVPLQKQLLFEILSLQQKLEVSSVDRGIILIQQRLCLKKVLLVLDDVDDLRQLEALAGGCNWFGNGSRIIVTTRDKHLLTCHEIYQDHVYKVKAMDDNEARELFSNHAFSTHPKMEIRTDLVDKVLNHARGLPLAIKVLGSFLLGRSECAWESTLNKLSRIPDETINNVLKISYDGLDENAKEIFLDIACFFKSKRIKYVKKVLDSCGYDATIGLEILIERSLISIPYHCLQVHDLIQSMGMDIVRQECCNDPGRRSRLWLYDDVVDVLSRDMGDYAIEAIVLKPPKLTEICIGSHAFTKLRKLRLLILENVHNSFQGPICLPNELRWFRWNECASCNLEFSSGPKKLVGFEMRNWSITAMPNQFKGFQQLKYMNLSECNSLVSTPDLSSTPNLEELYVFFCKNLLEIHKSMAYHDKLRVLHLSYCNEISAFPNVLQSKNLQRLVIDECSKLERFPDIPHKLEGLKELFIMGSAIKEFPASIENLCSLKSMSLSYCNNLASLPSNIYNLQNIEQLAIENCSNFIEFPKYEELIGLCGEIKLSNLHYLSLYSCKLSNVEFLEDLSCFPFLRDLYLEGNNISSLPTSISKRDHLNELYVGGCLKIPELPLSLLHLSASECDPLQNGHLTSIDWWVRRALTMSDTTSLAQTFSCKFALPKLEMPEWLQSIEGNVLSFMASQDLYDKFIGLVFYYQNFTDYRRGQLPEIAIFAYFNGERRNRLSNNEYIVSFECGKLCYCTPFELWGVVNFGQIDGSYAQFKLDLLRDGFRQVGFRIICKQLEEDLKVEIRDNQLINPAFLYEVSHNSTNSEAKTSDMYNDSPIEIDLLKNLRNCHMSTEEHSQRGSKRKPEFIFRQVKRIKTMLTSNSTDGDENEMGMINLLQNLHL